MKVNMFSISCFKKTNCAQISRKIKTTEFIFTWQEITDMVFFFFFKCFLIDILRGLLKRIINILRTLLWYFTFSLLVDMSFKRFYLFINKEIVVYCVANIYNTLMSLWYLIMFTSWWLFFIINPKHQLLFGESQNSFDNKRFYQLN